MPRHTDCSAATSPLRWCACALLGMAIAGSAPGDPSLQRSDPKLGRTDPVLRPDRVKTQPPPERTAREEPEEPTVPSGRETIAPRTPRWTGATCAAGGGTIGGIVQPRTRYPSYESRTGCGTWGYYPWGYARDFILAPRWNNTGAYVSDGATITERTRRVYPSPAPPPEPPPPPPTRGELLDSAFLAHDYTAAAGHIHAFILDGAGEDDPALRTRLNAMLALALAGNGMFDEARDVIRTSEADQTPIDGGVIDAPAIVGDPREVRRIIKRAVAAASRAKDPARWELVAFLMQAEGRPHVARRMIEKARRLRTPPPTPAPAPAKTGRLARARFGGADPG